MIGCLEIHMEGAQEKMIEFTKTISPFIEFFKWAIYVCGGFRIIALFAENKKEQRRKWRKH